MLRYHKPIYGQVIIENRESKKKIKLKIWSANALCAIIQTRLIPKEERKRPELKYEDYLVGFYADEQHLKNILKHEKDVIKFWTSRVVSIKLNIYYKESLILLKYFARSGHKVTCYYKEERAK